MRSQLNRGRRLISAFVPALAWWRASRARMFHSWRHRSGLSNEAAILIPRFGGSNPPAAASLYASARHTHHISGEQSFTPTSAGFGNRVLVGDPLHNSARNGSTVGKITGTKDAHGQCFVEPAELHRVYPAVADAAGNAAATLGNNDLLARTGPRSRQPVWTFAVLAHLAAPRGCCRMTWNRVTAYRCGAAATS